MNQLATQQDNPFARMQAQSTGMNVGAVAVEQERAVAEAQGKLTLAKRFPRDVNAAYSELMESCKLQALAEVAFYSVPRGNKTITGESIRLAEEIARCWGNIEYGHRELSRTTGKSEIEVYAWDMQTNSYNRRQLTVMHVIDTQQGPKPCRDQKEIDDLISNKASKQLRGRILAIVPKWMVEAAKEQCRLTLQGGNGQSLSERIRKMISAFDKLGVTNKMLEARLGHSTAECNPEELADLLGVYSSLKDGITKISEWFGPEAVAAGAENSTGEALKAIAKPSQKEAAAEQTTQAKQAAPAKQEGKAKAQKTETAAPQAEKKAEPKPTDPKKQPEPEPKPEPEPEPEQEIAGQPEPGNTEPENDPALPEKYDDAPQGTDGDFF